MDVDQILRAAEHGSRGALEVLDDWARERGQRATDFTSTDAETFELVIGYGDGYGGGDGYGDGDGDGYGAQLSIRPLVTSESNGTAEDP